MMNPELEKQYKLYIGGEWREAADGGTFESHCPADGRLLAKCAKGSKADVDAAVKAAWKAWEGWKKTSPAERAKVLNRIAEVIDANADRLAMIETLDNGKPIRESRQGDIPEAAAHFRYYAGAIQAEEGAATMLDETTLNLILREPIGVAGQIIPWNFPFSMAAWKLAPVLAAGCCTVFKPASETSLSVLTLMTLIGDIVPPGVINIVTGDGKNTGGFILEHPDIVKLAFTGSTEVGYEVAKAAAEKLVPATLELGGKSANIIFEDCRWDLAMDGAVAGILGNQGQVCSAGSRILVQRSIYDRFVRHATAVFNRVKVGMPWEHDTQMGAIINQKQMEKILEYIQIGRDEGATVSCGGVRLTANGLDKGSFIAPTLLTNVGNSMRVAREEIFGPVAVVIPFTDENEAVAIANDSDYGLAGAVFTENITRAIRVARGVRTGRMWVNTYGASPAGAPFGGYKKSGIGRETHKVALDAYSQLKSIIVNLSREPSGAYDLSS